jgi:hypothetical protein
MISGDSLNLHSPSLPILVRQPTPTTALRGFEMRTADQPILFASERYPLYLPTTFRKLASRLGVSVASEAADGLHVKHSVLNYPLVPLRVEPPAYVRSISSGWLSSRCATICLTARSCRSFGIFPNMPCASSSTTVAATPPRWAFSRCSTACTATTGFRCRPRAGPPC